MQKLKLDKGWIIIFLLLALSVIFWVITPKLEAPFSSLQNSLISLGEIFGLLGMILFSINIILSTRLSSLEMLFDGLNNVYKKHNFLGQLAFVLLLFHPILLLPRYALSFKEAFSFLFVSDLWARNLGIFALWLMIFLIIITLYLRPKYNIWKITHKFFGTALFLGALHVYLIPGYIMKNPLLKGYVLFIAILGILAFLYKSILGKFFIKKYIYVVENLVRLNNKVIEVTLKAKSENLNFKPGQFIFVSFKQKELSSESHPFSIISAPEEKLLKISIKKLGDCTAKLYTKLKVGANAEIEGPFGTFSYTNTKNKNQVWIAGGIGITPFLSFIKDLRNKFDYSINLYYCVTDNQEAVYLNFFKEESEKNHQVNIIPFYSKEKGHISMDYLKNNLNNFIKKEFFICAPAKMIKEISADLIENGINKNNIISEEFDF